MRTTRWWAAVVVAAGGVLAGAHQSRDSLRPAANKAEALSQVWDLRQRISGPAASLSADLKILRDVPFDPSTVGSDVKKYRDDAEGQRRVMRDVTRRIETQRQLGFTACDEVRALREDQALRLADLTTRVPELETALTRGESLTCNSGTTADMQAQAGKAANALNAALAALQQIAAAVSKMDELQSHKADAEFKKIESLQLGVAAIQNSGTAVSAALRGYGFIRGIVAGDLDFVRRTYGAGAPFDLSSEISAVVSELRRVDEEFGSTRWPSSADIDRVVTDVYALQEELRSLAQDSSALRTRAAPHYSCNIASIAWPPSLGQLVAGVERAMPRVATLTTRATECAQRQPAAGFSPAPTTARTLVRLAFPQPSVTIKVGATFARPELYAYYSDAPDTPVTPLGLVQYSGIPLPFAPSRPMSAFLTATLDGQNASMTVHVEAADASPSSARPPAPPTPPAGSNSTPPPKPAPDPTVPAPTGDPAVRSPGPPPTAPAGPPRGEFDWAGTWELTADNARDSAVLTLARLDAAGGTQELQNPYAGSLLSICRSSDRPTRVYTGRLAFGGGDIYAVVACTSGSDLDGRLGIAKDSQPKGLFSFTEGSPYGSWGPMAQLWNTLQWRIRQK